MTTDPYSTISIDRALRPFTAVLAVGSLLAFGYAGLRGAPAAALIPGIVFVATLVAVWIAVVAAVGRSDARRDRAAALDDGHTVLDLPTAPTLALGPEVVDAAIIITGAETVRDLPRELVA